MSENVMDLGVCYPELHVLMWKSDAKLCVLNGFSNNIVNLVPARYSGGPLFRKSIVQIRDTVRTFELRLGLRLGLGLGLGSVLGLGLGLVGIVDFRNSGLSK